MISIKRLLTLITIFAISVQISTAQSFSTPVNTFELPTLYKNSGGSFVDIDNDGDLDLFLGQGNSDRISYYKNEGTSTVPSFTYVGFDLYGLLESNLSGYTLPIFGDLDADGDQDAIVCEEGYGLLNYFENTGSPTAPQFVQGKFDTLPKLSTISSDLGISNNTEWSYGNIATLGDLDGDGDLDLLTTGGVYGDLFYIENIGTKYEFKFEGGIKNPFGMSNLSSQAYPRLVDFDKDGDLDIMASRYSGDIIYLENKGTKTSPSFQSQVKNPFGIVKQAAFAYADFVDLDSDDDIDLIYMFPSQSLNESVLFSENNHINTTVVYGCTDTQANNYNSSATRDNGSCTYPVVYGCTDPNAINYNANATKNNGTCSYYEVIPGCMDPAANNYNPNANANDGSCTYGTISGCTDPLANNYNPNATSNDGSCTYNQVVWGCTDPLANNYNSNATDDDGSCTYGETKGPYNGVYATIPGTIEAERYDEGGEDVSYSDSETENRGGAFRNDGVDIESMSSASGGYSVGYIAANEWLEYTVDVTAGTYDLIIRYATASSNNPKIQIYMDGNDLVNNLPLSSTGGWTTWDETTVNNVSVSAGRYYLRIQTLTGDFNIDKITFTSSGSSISGCTDPSADNYNSSATIDNGSCTYSSANDCIKHDFSGSGSLDGEKSPQSITSNLSGGLLTLDVTNSGQWDEFQFAIPRMDFSNAPSYKMYIRAKASSNVVIKPTFIDEAGNTASHADLNAGNHNDESSNTLTLTTNWRTFTIDFANNLKNQWQCACDLDETKIDSINIGINPGYSSFPFTDEFGNTVDAAFSGQIDIDYITVADAGCTNVVVGDISSFEETTFEAFPNPLDGDIIHFSKKLDSIELIGSLGEYYGKFEQVEELNVSHLNQGLYLIKSSSGGSVKFIKH